MRIVLVSIIGVAVVLVLLLLVVSSIGSRAFRRRYETEKAALLARGRSAAPSFPDAISMTRLPAPVRRYLDTARGIDGPALRVAILRQRGMLRSSDEKPWMPFDSEQVYSVEPPGFVWMATAHVAPLVRLMARDKFVDGRGNMLISLLGAVTVADARGAEMDLGAGLRYWGEIIAFPEVVGSRYLRWEPLTDRQARVVIEQANVKATAVVEFGDDGRPTAIHAERYRDVNGSPVLTAWSGHSRQWKLVDGRLFPTEWESVWHLPGGDFAAVKMEILRIRTE